MCIRDRTISIPGGEEVARRTFNPHIGVEGGLSVLGTDVYKRQVEGEPEDTSCEAVIEAVKAAGYTKVILRPLMGVAGDHANNDMAGEDADSWLSQFTAAGCFENVDCQISGLGRIEMCIRDRHHTGRSQRQQ